jgi:hypothetical protein
MTDFEALSAAEMFTDDEIAAIQTACASCGSRRLRRF